MKFCQLPRCSKKCIAMLLDYFIHQTFSLRTPCILRQVIENTRTGLEFISTMLSFEQQAFPDCGLMKSCEVISDGSIRFSRSEKTNIINTHVSAIIDSRHWFMFSIFSSSSFFFYFVLAQFGKKDVMLQIINIEFSILYLPSVLSPQLVSFTSQ